MTRFKFGEAEGGGLLVIVGKGANCGIAESAFMLVRAAVMVAAVMLATAAFMLMFDIPCNPIGILTGRGKGKGKGNGVGFGAGRGS